MEDIIALVLVVGVLSLAVAIIVKFFKNMHETSKRQALEQIKRQEEADKYWESRRQKAKVSVTPKVEGYVNRVDKAEPVKVPPKKTETYTSTTSSSSDDSFLTGMVVGALLDNAFSHKTEERSVGVSSRESSWGFDDSDSRKSISDSMDTSSSWSSSSSDSWSSSDSGPSSDW